MLAGIAAAGSPILESPTAVAVARGLVPTLYVAVGALLRRDRPAAGGVLVAVGAGYALTTPIVSGDPVWHSLGRLAAAAWLLLFAYAFLVQPLGRLTGRPERLLLGAYAAVAGTLWALAAVAAETLPAGGALSSCGGRCPANGLQVVAAPDWVTHLLARSIGAVTTLFLAALLAVLLRRAATSIVSVRLTALPPFLAATALAAGYVASTAHPAGYTWWVVCATLTGAGALACPLSFAAGPLIAELFVSRSFVRGVASLDPAAMTSADVEGVCRAALGDASARLAFVGGSHVLLVDRTLARGHERVVDMVERLAVTLADFSQLLRGLRSSRRRIAEQETHERARLERDLHDGAQQRLLALQLQLAELAEEVRGSALEAAVESIAREAATASVEVRTISHGIYPSLLVERGLADTIRSLPASPSMPIHVVAGELPRTRPSTERAVYFAVAEAVQNATKHSNASAITVELRYDGGTLEAVVSDDGIGYDADGGETDPGLVGLRDRIESAGGTVGVSSAAGEGTSVTFRVPVEP